MGEMLAILLRNLLSPILISTVSVQKHYGLPAFILSSNHFIVILVCDKSPASGGVFSFYFLSPKLHSLLFACFIQCVQILCVAKSIMVLEGKIIHVRFQIIYVNEWTNPGCRQL